MTYLMGELNALDLRWLTLAARENLTGGANITVPPADGIGPHVVPEELKLVKATLAPSAAITPREEDPASELSLPRRVCLTQKNVVCSAMGRCSARTCRQSISYDRST